MLDVADQQGESPVSGSVIQLFSKRSFDFSGGNGTVVVVRSVPVERWTEAQINVRVHTNAIASGSGTIVVNAKSISLTQEEMQTDFLDGTILATASVGNGTAAGTLVRGAVTAAFGAALQILVVGTKGTSATVVANLSAELVLKD
jgi:hypothetical protein